MYQMGDLVVYGFHGVCKVVDTEERTVDKKKVQYLVLEPQDQGTSRYLVPCGNPNAMAKLRPVLCLEELIALLESDDLRQDVWIPDENRRKQLYRELIGSGDRVALLQMVHTLHVQKDVQQAAGRKFHLCDENFLRDAQRLLSSEFSAVLGIPSSEVGDYILNRMAK